MMTDGGRIKYLTQQDNSSTLLGLVLASKEATRYGDKYLIQELRKTDFRSVVE